MSFEGLIILGLGLCITVGVPCYCILLARKLILQERRNFLIRERMYRSLLQERLQLSENEYESEYEDDLPPTYSDLYPEL